MPNPTLPKNLKSFLFVCTGNSCRSVMAEGLFRKMMQDKGEVVEIASAGVSTFPGIGATEETIHAMRELGIDVSKHRGQIVSKKLLLKYDLIVVMHKMHREQILKALPDLDYKVVLVSDFYEGEKKDYVKSGVPDPIGMGSDFYKNVLEIIKDALDNMFSLMRPPTK